MTNSAWLKISVASERYKNIFDNFISQLINFHDFENFCFQKEGAFALHILIKDTSHWFRQIKEPNK